MKPSFFPGPLSAITPCKWFGLLPNRSCSKSCFRACSIRHGVLFPEGTRHKDGRLGKGNRGVGKIIHEIRPVVIPTALIGLNTWKFPGFGQSATAVFGKPLDFSDLYELENCKETHQLIVERVMNAIAELLKNEGAYVGEA